MNFRQFLCDEFDRRKRANGAYSLRAFARDLHCPPSRLSEILNAKAGISRGRAEAMADQLGLQGRTKDVFVLSAEESHGKGKVARSHARRELKRLATESHKIFDLKEFQMISEWHYFAILEALHIKSACKSLAGLASIVGVPLSVAKKALADLAERGLVRQNKKAFSLGQNDRFVGNDIPSAAIKNFHEQILAKARRALWQQPVESREFSSAFVALDADRLEEFKAELRALRKKFYAEVADRSVEKHELYCLSMQFFKIQEDEQ